MILLASRFQLKAAARSWREPKLVRFTDNDYGLYFSRFINVIGTPLAARGTETELKQLLTDLRSGRDD